MWHNAPRRRPLNQRRKSRHYAQLFSSSFEKAFSSSWSSSAYAQSFNSIAFLSPLDAWSEKREIPFENEIAHRKGRARQDFLLIWQSGRAFHAITGCELWGWVGSNPPCCAVFCLTAHTWDFWVDTSRWSMAFITSAALNPHRSLSVWFCSLGTNSWILHSNETTKRTQITTSWTKSAVWLECCSQLVSKNPFRDSNHGQGRLHESQTIPSYGPLNLISSSFKL